MGSGPGRLEPVGSGGLSRSRITRSRSVRAAEDELRNALAELGPGARRDLLCVLTSPPHVLADVIRQFFERPGVRWREGPKDVPLGEDTDERAALQHQDAAARLTVVRGRDTLEWFEGGFSCTQEDRSPDEIS